jgi:UDP-galactopyranose mutase
LKPLLVVGAGFAGAVHARELAEAGWPVHVIDKRTHVAGNAYDYVDQNGIRVHAYGPHLFHTRQRRVVEWITRFGSFVPYTHRVRAALPGGGFAPMPINLDTVNMVFGENFAQAEEVEAHLRRVSVPIEEPRNAAEYLHSRIGVVLTDLFFRPYTKKMWALDLEEMSAAVIKRLPLRTDRTDTYFPTEDVQMMPQDGYTKLFDNIFDHANITLMLGTDFSSKNERDYEFCFNSMAIDEYFNFVFGELPYRSLKFHHLSGVTVPDQHWSVTNYTDDGIFTRETAWHILPGHLVSDTGKRTLTREEPCDYRDNNRERFYPVKDADGRANAVYQKYRMLAEQKPDLAFIGRCGTYQYLDMDQVINQSLAHVRDWLSQHCMLA